LYADCARLTRISIPASRLAVAIELRRSGRMNQSDIAARLGVAQAAISKYENRRLSDRIFMLARFIVENGMASKAANIVSKGASGSAIAKEIDLIASSSRVFRKASALLSASKP